MPRIRFLYIDCVFLDDGFCGASTIKLDPDVGCASYKRTDDFGLDEDLKGEDEDEELEDWEEIDLEDDDLWSDDDDF